MKRSIVLGMILAGGLLFMLTPSSVLANCPSGVDQGLNHAVGGYFKDCPDGLPVKAFAYVLGNSTGINSGAVDLACEDKLGSNGQLSPCNPEAGQAGDGNVTVQFDWGAGGTFPGCPNPGRLEGVGRNVVQLIANNGASIFVSVGFSPDLGQYPVDFAQIPDAITGSAPISCSSQDGGLSVTSFDAAQLCVNMKPPKVYTDCDAGTWGLTGGPIGFTPTCNTSQIPRTKAGRLYGREADCATVPNDAFVQLSPLWTLLGSADAAGNLCVTRPGPINADFCLFVASSGIINDPLTNADAETLATTGIPLRIAGQNAPSTRALDVRAAQTGANIVVTFRTASELELVGFNIVTDAKGGKQRIQVNDALIAGKGIGGGGASYEVALPRGKFQGGKVLYVESLLRSGNRILSDPAKF